MLAARFSLGFRLGEKRSGEVPLGGVGKNRNNRLPCAETLCELQRSKDVRSGGDAGKKPFLRREIARATKRFLVGDDADVGVYLRIQVVGYKPVSNAHLKMSANRASRENSGVLRLDSPDFYAGILRLQHFANAAEGSTRPDARTETVDRQNWCS